MSPAVNQSAASCNGRGIVIIMIMGDDPLAASHER